MFYLNQPCLVKNRLALIINMTVSNSTGDDNNNIVIITIINIFIIENGVFKRANSNKKT